jgi:hypothetical protein
MNRAPVRLAYASVQTQACLGATVQAAHLGPNQEKAMPKGQQRGNKESKKPKKAAGPTPIPAGLAHAPPTPNAAPPRWLKK